MYQNHNLKAERNDKFYANREEYCRQFKNHVKAHVRNMLNVEGTMMFHLVQERTHIFVECAS